MRVVISISKQIKKAYQMADQSKHLIDQRSGNSGAKTQSLMLSEVEAAAQEFCKKILSVFQDNMPVGRTEPPQNQESSEQPQNQESRSSEQPQNQESSEQPQNQEFMLEQELDVIQDSSPTTIITPETQQPLSLEAQDYLKGRKHVYYLPLYLAAIGGDWNRAKSFIESDQTASTARITAQSLTTLMVAIRACQWKFARKLLEDLPSKSLETVDMSGRTALHYAVMGGSLETAKALIRKNSALPQIPTNEGWVPLYSVTSNKQLLWYLILVTRDEHPCFPFTGPLSVQLVVLLIGSGHYDIILYLVRKYPTLAFMQHEEEHLLTWLSIQYSDFLSGSNLTFWERWIYKLIHIQVPPHSVSVHMEDFQDEAASVQPMLKCLYRLLWKVIEKLAPPLKQVREEKLKHVYAVELVNHICRQLSALTTFEETFGFFKSDQGCRFLFVAASFGIVEFIRTCLKYFPDLIFLQTEFQSNLLQVAIEKRQTKIFNLIKEMPTIALQLNVGTQKSEMTTTLHLAAKLAPPSQLLSVSGSALQMQRELQWFKEVDKITLPGRKRMPNAEGLTPKELFTKEHKKLAADGEKWMKDTANSGMIVTTLIATVVLAAAFTVPGGNNNAGVPIFLHKTSFLIFVVSDALALFSSITSLLMFLSIITARYAEKDFLRALPKRLIFGLGSLFFAIASMMVVFGVTLSIVLSEKWQWAFIPIVFLASIPVAVFAMLQLPLFIQMINSTYGSGVF